ncbi:MAG: Gfo/Idh/MocA family oxidoreductase [Kiritimatiellaeota bacterium]|nr:Gfo/Idh/MocA family oxidoreductase [Kiritimatiellota bacterium]
MKREMMPQPGYSRRNFLRGALLGAGALALNSYGADRKNKPGQAHQSPKPRTGRQPAKPGAAKLFLAAVGCGGKGDSDIAEMMGAGMSIGALCDVDETLLNKKAAVVREKFPDVRLYRDFREMLAKEKDRIHAVTVSIPDHMHAPAAALAMSLGKHVYCQKPLTHTIWEARRLRELAQSSGVVTQMGNHGSASAELRRGVEVLQAGVIGPVREVHVWTNRPVWPQGLERPTQVDPVPATLAWNLWLGVAPDRPFAAKIYHPFKWRGWHDFGTGALGDMACHTCNLAFRALNLGYATEVEAVAEGGTSETYSKRAKVRFQFPARPNPVKPGEMLPPVTFMWYEGGWKPGGELCQDVVEFSGSGQDKHGQETPAKLPIAGCYFIGDQGRLFSSGDYGGGNVLRLNGEPKLRGISKHAAAVAVPETLPRSGNNYREWVEACVANKPNEPYSRIDIAAYLTEIILVGCFALRLPGRKILWDGPNMHSPNTPEVAPLVKGIYRSGWTI